MSFGQNMSRKPRSKPVYYRFGYKDETPKHWYTKRIGWFGHTILVVTVGLFGLFVSQASQMILHAGGQLSNEVKTGSKEGQAALLTGQGPGVATNIVEVQSLLSGWAKEHGPMQWGIAVKSIDGPNMDGAVQANASFEARANYKLFLATVVYDQFPPDAQYRQTVKAGKSKVSVATCLERLLKNDDADCADALGALIDPQKAKALWTTNKMTHTNLLVQKRTVQTTPADTVTLLLGLKGSMLPAKTMKAFDRNLTNLAPATKLAVACPGCTPTGVADYGVGRLEAAGIVKYSKGNYAYVVYANGGTKDLVMQLSGKLQQLIVETTTPSLKPKP